MEDYLKELNSSQKNAATHIDGPLLILAGAGSGKTKTITTRLAYLLSLGIDPANTLTLTFTNKAASSMRDRALNMIDKRSVPYPPLLCTFHKFGLIFLKFYINKLDRKIGFVVIDTDDKKKILKEIDDTLPIGFVVSEISKYKNALLEPNLVIEKAENDNYKKIALIYEKYQNYINENNLIDFDDLIALPYMILDKYEDVRDEVSQRYQYLMVDEYQDTNDLQFKLLKKICYTHNNICVVGDDDQSIYGFRGANVKNILEFHNMFDNTKVVKLEENYRSTSQILKAANELIEHNRNRLGKKLVSTIGDGKEIGLIESNDENEEADKIAKMIKNLVSNGVNQKNIAILFRINALSRSIEEGLNRAGIAYKLVGGVRFYERLEIKDLISYFRLVVNPHDDFSLKRVINRPKRGIGKTTLEKIEKNAYTKKLSIFNYLQNTDEKELSKNIGKKDVKPIKEFCENISILQQYVENSMMRFIDEFDSVVKFKESFENTPESFDRLSNIDEFFGLFRDFVKNSPFSNLDDFLNDISLQSDSDIADDEMISIMSVHASKGLEFEYLFVIGLEEGFFPLLGDGCDIEEERRLGYVALTRAKKELTLSYVNSRFYKGKRTRLDKSRFLKEAGLIKGSFSMQTSATFKKGDLVSHKIFGIGRVLEVQKINKDYKLKINFGGSNRDILSSFVEKA
ncbi:MAG: UvrD-helicase domain-containing protein [Campylobacterales bacterium]|nr:UvrD-helicase domain-containing protein [Campylobacterales bacterium]